LKLTESHTAQFGEYLLKSLAKRHKTFAF